MQGGRGSTNRPEAGEFKTGGQVCDPGHCGLVLLRAVCRREGELGLEGNCGLTLDTVVLSCLKSSMQEGRSAGAGGQGSDHGHCGQVPGRSHKFC